jgi:mono/diheme cytochrome c family protein
VHIEDSDLPDMPFDLMAGGQVYQVDCSGCHGDTGWGDGPMAADQPLAPAALADASIMLFASPADWFSLLGSGESQQHIPSFGGKLSRQERWDVVGYALSLGIQESMLSRGQELYALECAYCHGARGDGKGLKAPSLEQELPDWQDPARLVDLSLAGLMDTISQGIPPGMPSYGGLVPQEDLLTLAAYLRSFANSGEALAASIQATPAPQRTPLLASQASPITGVVVSGRVSSPDVMFDPAGIPITLEGYEGMQAVWQAETTAGVDGSYRFEDVALSTGRVYVAWASYQDVVFSSAPLHTADLSPGQESPLNIVVFGSSRDTSQLYVERMHVFFEFLETGELQVMEMYSIANPVRTVIIPSAPGEGVIRFRLPEGASDIRFQENAGEGFLVLQDGFWDARVIPPSPRRHQVVFSFSLPYSDPADLVFPLPLPVRSIVLAVPAGGVELVSDQLRRGGIQQSEGSEVQLFEGSALLPNEPLKLRISGRPRYSLPSGYSTSGNLVAAAFVLAIVLILGGTWILRQLKARRLISLPPGATRESQMDAILALDDQYRAGQIPQEPYLKRRSELKAVLRETLEREGSTIDNQE